jgi:hypothetical protein
VVWSKAIVPLAPVITKLEVAVPWITPEVLVIIPSIVRVTPASMITVPLVRVKLFKVWFV